MANHSIVDPRTPVLVVGLGRFGSALALELVERGQEVMAIDKNPVLVQRHAGVLTHVVQADTTDAEALEQLGAGDFQIAVCGIGTSIEDSVLTVVNLVELGVDSVWAKAVTNSHRTILERIGASRVILPEQDAGERAAHLLTGRMMNFLEFSSGFAIAQAQAPKALTGKPLNDLQIRRRFGVTVVAYAPAGSAGATDGTAIPGTEFHNALPETVLSTQDVLILAGPIKKLEELTEGRAHR